jgi:hypothetical protein
MDKLAKKMLWLYPCVNEIDGDTIDYFKAEAEQVGIPYQTLINLYLADCVSNNRELQLTWN